MTHRTHRRSGLTVLELVSALALFIIILGTLLVALNSATDLWTRSANKNRDLQKVRQALDLLATDLTCAVAPPSQKWANADLPSSTLGTAQHPLFIAEGNATLVGLYFIKTLSSSELSVTKQLSMELVAYCWTTNGLSRYTFPVLAETPPTSEPDLSLQLSNFRNYRIPATPSNILSSAISGFAPLLYQPLKISTATIDTEPAHIGKNDPSVFTNVRLADLPDFVDVLVAYVDRTDWANSSSTTNYLTRRITLPAAQASRLP